MTIVSQYSSKPIYYPIEDVLHFGVYILTLENKKPYPPPPPPPSSRTFVNQYDKRVRVCCQFEQAA